jgi:hypothetical protein
LPAAYSQRLAAFGFPVARFDPKAEPAFLRYPVWVTDRVATEKSVAPIGMIETWFTSILEEATPSGTDDYRPGSCAAGRARGKAPDQSANAPARLRLRLRGDGRWCCRGGNYRSITCAEITRSRSRFVGAKVIREYASDDRQTDTLGS